MAHHIPNFLKGYNITSIVYGQTGAGKSHTLFGEPGSFNANIDKPSDAIRTISSDEENNEPYKEDFPHHYGILQRTVVTLLRALQGSRSILTMSVV